MKVSTLAFATALLALGACQEDKDSGPQLAGLYQTESTIKAGPLQVYTSSGVVSSPAVAASLLRRHWSMRSSFLKKDSVISPDNSLTLLFEADNRVTLTANYSGGSRVLALEATSRNAQRYLLSAMDSATVIAASGAQSRCELLADQVREHEPARRCFLVALMPGAFQSACRFRPLQVLTIRNNQPVIPLYSWFVLVSRSGTVCGQGQGFEWNLPSSNLVQRLASGDTVLVQVNELALRKK
ncbi:hypothetical protein [Hymenobacter guriensis]|uniref:Uncharacterized protein n=1 Tax=Hymenobacter guriensis TaxID=2793065 RepID=A0ABS0KWK4_9BACT|nr:hypothetical protein [Hymenobacter guriensis]MBG8552249.1 hypothetical protein [Hymenobacter guriensis]